MDKITPSEEKMLEALTRSGYLLEGEVARLLMQFGYFFEPSPVILDEHTGKSREFDIKAEKRKDFMQDNISCRCTMTLAIEVKNNAAPLVLLNDTGYFRFAFDDKVRRAINQLKSDRDYYDNDLQLLFHHDGRLMTQYCSFTERKTPPQTKEERTLNPLPEKELIADHIEGYHDSLLKILYFCDEQLDLIKSLEKNSASKLLEVLFPMLVVRDDLYLLNREENNEHKLVKVEEGKLVRNYHYKGIEKTGMIHVITKKGLPSFLSRLTSFQRTIREKYATNYSRIQVSKEEFEKFFGDFD